MSAEELPDDKQRYFIDEIHLNQLTTTAHDLPYMKYVELTNFTPQHFGLTAWVPQFKIPDCWMKKIYKNEVYKDTDLPEPDVEAISEKQKKYLFAYLDERDQTEYGRPSRSIRPIAPEDDIKIDLNGQDHIEQDDSDSNSDDGVEVIQIDSDSSEQVFIEKTRCDKQASLARPSPPPPLKESISNNIAVCRHKIQPEEVVVQMALEKMKNSSPSEDKRYRELLNDKEFMKLLDQHIEKYL